MQTQLLLQQISHSLQDTQEIAQSIVTQLIEHSLSEPICVHFNAPMGAGKTTLIKSIIQCFDSNAMVTSPTYSLMQEYAFDQGMIYHLDLYRLEQPEELLYFGLIDLLVGNTLCLIEWPNRAIDYLPQPTYVANIKVENEIREITLLKANHQ